MLKKFIGALAVCVLVCAVPSASVLAADSEAVPITAAAVTADVLNFRSEPMIGENVIGTAEKDNVVVVYAEENDWCRVLFGGKEGWMSRAYLEYLSEADLELGSAIITGDSVRLRSAPSGEAEITALLSADDAVSVIGVAGQWLRVVYGDLEGYVFGAYVHIAGKAGDYSALREQLADTAAQQLKTRCVWGGQSPDTGFDCSGLIRYVYGECGITVPRTLSALYGTAVKISRDELLPGDLVFFASSSGWYVSHAGIYIGDGCFIHASSGSGCVRTNELSDAYYDKYYYGAAGISVS